MEDDNPPIDLEALDLYLDSDHAPDDCMGLSYLDGFLTGIIVGPEPIPQSEWAPVIWGGEEPEFDSESETWTVLGTIMGRYHEIATCFHSDPDKFESLFLEGPNGEVIVSDWAGGFLDAIALRPKAWGRLFIDRQAKIMIEPFLVLNGDAELPARPDGAADEAKFFAEAPDLISTCVLGIHEFWKKSRRRPKSAPRRDQRSKR